MRAYKIIVMVALLLAASSLLAFILLRADDGAVVHWTNLSPVYWVNKNTTNSTTQACMADPVVTVQDAFSAWNHAAPLTISVNYGGTTSITDFCGMSLDDTGCDSTNVILFSKQWEGGSFPAGALAVTVTNYSTADGVIYGVDMVFNDAIKWSDDPYNNANDLCKGSSVYSLAAVVTHESGHFYGLDHSFVAYVGENFDPSIAATMFPVYFGNTVWLDMASLEQDDKAGVYYLYPGAPDPGWGRIKGTVKDQTGKGFFGVHVQAIRKSDAVPVLGVLSESDGSYLLYGLTPDDYYAYAESPYIAGEFFTSWISTYYQNADSVPYVQLYSKIQINNYAQLAAGSTVFSRATPITVAAGATVAGIDFSYTIQPHLSPPTTSLGNNHGDDGGNGGCGCVLNPGLPLVKPDIDLASISALLLLSGLSLRSIRRKKAAA